MLCLLAQRQNFSEHVLIKYYHSGLFGIKGGIQSVAVTPLMISVDKREVMCQNETIKTAKHKYNRPGNPRNLEQPGNISNKSPEDMDTL